MRIAQRKKRNAPAVARIRCFAMPDRDTPRSYSPCSGRSQLKLYGFSPSGSYIGRHADLDADGRSTFPPCATENNTLIGRKPRQWKLSKFCSVYKGKSSSTKASTPNIL